MVSKFLHACTCDVDYVFAWFMFYSSHIYMCVCEMKMLQQASKRTFRFNRSLALDVRIEIHRQGRCQPEQPCQKARFFGMISLKSTGWFLEAQPRLPGGNTSFISFMSFPWVSRDLKRSQESSHLGLRGGEPAEEGDLDLVDRVAYRSSRCLDAKCQESEWDQNEMQNEMEGWEGTSSEPAFSLDLSG